MSEECTKDERMKVDGKRAQLFRVAVQGVAKQIVMGVSEEEFSKIFASIWKEKHCKKYYKSFAEIVLQKLLSEVDDVFSDDSLEINKKLLSLQNILAENGESNKEKGWRPPLNAHEQIRSHVMEAKLKQKLELEKYIDYQEMQIQSLMRQVKRGRQKFHEMQKEMADLRENLSSNFDVNNSFVWKQLKDTSTLENSTVDPYDFIKQ